MSVSVPMSDDTDMIQKGGLNVKKNIVIISNKTTPNNIFTIFNIPFNDFDFNDQLESLKKLSKYIVSQRRKNVKTRRTKKPLNKGNNH